MDSDPKKSQPISSRTMIPLAIIVAGALIAGAVLYASGNGAPRNAAIGDIGKDQRQGAARTSDAAAKIKPVTDKDHILGNPNAEVFVVEFSDTECPFCQRFHKTMHQLIDEYGSEGKVAWVYRHFPLDAIHPKSRKEAAATECANELGGNTKFWAYVDRIFEITPANNNLDPAELPKIAEYVGLDRALFETCLSSGKFAKRVSDDVEDAVNSGGQGTPYSVVIARSGKKFVINGAQPYEAAKAIIDAALLEK